MASRVCITTKNRQKFPFLPILRYDGEKDMDKTKKRKNTRLKEADYNRNGVLFLTVCTKDRRCILSRIVGTGTLFVNI